MTSKQQAQKMFKRMLGWNDGYVKRAEKAQEEFPSMDITTEPDDMPVFTSRPISDTIKEPLPF